MYSSKGNIQDAEGFHRAADMLETIAHEHELMSVQLTAIAAVTGTVLRQFEPHGFATRMIRDFRERAKIIQAEWDKEQEEAKRKADLGRNPVGPNDTASKPYVPTNADIANAERFDRSMGFRTTETLEPTGDQLAEEALAESRGRNTSPMTPKEPFTTNETPSNSIV